MVSRWVRGYHTIPGESPNPRRVVILSWPDPALSRQVRGELRTGPALPPPWRLFSCCTMRSCHSLLLLLLIAPPLQADRQRGHVLADRRRGHIFVMNTDLRFLACDAWLCPVSEAMELSPRWQRSIRECEQPERPRGWGSSIRAVRCLPRTAAALRRRREERYKQYEHPRPYLTLVMGEPLPASLLSLNQFLDQVVADLRGRSRFGRALPLVAVPIFGAGVAAAELLQFGNPSLSLLTPPVGAGLAAEDVLRGDEQSGEIIAAMLRELHAFASRHACDVALCTVDSSAFGAAQQAPPALAARQPLSIRFGPEPSITEPTN